MRVRRIVIAGAAALAACSVQRAGYGPGCCGGEFSLGPDLD